MRQIMFPHNFVRGALHRAGHTVEPLGDRGDAPVGVPD